MPGISNFTRDEICERWARDARRLAETTKALEKIRDYCIWAVKECDPYCCGGYAKDIRDMAVEGLKAMEESHDN